MSVVELHLGTRNPYRFGYGQEDSLVVWAAGTPAFPVIKDAAEAPEEFHYGSEYTTSGVHCLACSKSWGVKLYHASFDHCRACLSDRLASLAEAEVEAPLIRMGVL
jgi:hypothetical protein